MFFFLIFCHKSEKNSVVWPKRKLKYTFYLTFMTLVKQYQCNVVSKETIGIKKNYKVMYKLFNVSNMLFLWASLYLQ